MTNDRTDISELLYTLGMSISRLMGKLTAWSGNRMGEWAHKKQASQEAVEVETPTEVRWALALSDRLTKGSHFFDGLSQGLQERRDKHREERAAKILEAERQERETTTSGGLKTRFYPVHEYQGFAFLDSQYGQVGYLTERWADVVDGFGEKAEEFWKAFDESRQARRIGGRKQWVKLRSTGLTSPTRVVDMTQRGPVTVAVLVALQGNDLYLSWRCFVHNPVSLLRVTIWLLLVAAPALFLSRYREYGSYFGSARWEVDGEQALLYFGAGAAITGLLMIFYGLTKWQGDAFKLLRSPIHELQYDEVASLSTGIHRCLLDAADKVGIDVSQLESREPAYLSHNQKRRI